jgi:hypothetical protein
MPIVLADRVKEITSSNGSGNITFSGPLAGFQSFSSVLASGDQTYYTIVNKNNWEVGVGTYQSSTFSRDVILSSSNNGQRLNLAGNSTVFIAYPAEKSVYKDEVQRIVVESGIIFPDSSVQTTAFTAETAQDIVSSLLTAGTGIQLTYNDSGNSLAIDAYGILPTGGTTGQILSKIDGVNYNTQWIDNYTTEVVQYVKNSSHTTLNKGQVVYINGADGTNPTIALAIASGESGSSKTLGFLKQTLAQGEFGYVVTEGELGGLNTDAANTDGDTVWLSPTTPGDVVYGLANKPSAPNHMVFLGYVVRKNINNGRIFVKVQNGFELEELHNVVAKNPNDGDIIRYNSASGLWQAQALPASYSDEQSQDAVGGILSNTPTINLSYSDNTPSISAILNDTTVSTGIYGSANQVGSFTVDQQGRITNASNISITPSGIGAIGSLNGLIDSNQVFATGTTGTNFNIVSSGTTHTFNIPDASATARGVVTTGSQTFSGVKTFQNDLRCYRLSAVVGVQNLIEFVSGSAVRAIITEQGNQEDWGFFLTSSAYSLGVRTTGRESQWVAETSNTWASRRGTNSQTFRIYNTFTDTSNYERLALQFGTFSSVRHTQIAAESAGTGAANMNLVLTPKGTGAFIVGPPPDGTIVGGNARGASAVDLRTIRSAATQVASGSSSFLGPNGVAATGSGAVAFGGTASGSNTFCLGPSNNTASGGVNLGVGTEGQNNATGVGSTVISGRYNTTNGSYAVVFGQSCAAIATASLAGGESCGTNSGADFSTSLGISALSRLHGEFALASGRFSTSGDCQKIINVLRCTTTTNTAVEMLFAVSRDKRFVIPAGYIWHGLATITGTKSDGSAVAVYMRQISIKRVSNTTSLVGSVTTIGTDQDAGTSISITADDTNESLKIEPTGILNETWRWICVLDGSLVAFGI